MGDILVVAAFLAFSWLSLLLLYHWHFWRNRRARAALWWTLGILAVVSIAKYAIAHLATGYVAGRMIFYARPEPRVNGIPYLLLMAAALWALVEWYRRKHAWGRGTKLAILWLVFVCLSAGVGGLRDGAAGIAEPFTRTDWEYIADARLVTNIPEFLRDYVASYPLLSMHGKTHPPGNALLIYALEQLFEVGTLGLALLVLLIGGLLVFPVYFFWRRYLPESELEDIMPIFMLTPSVVMFSATSMDIVALPVFWLALLVCDMGWRRNLWLSFAGGVFAGCALLLSFQFLVFGLVLLFFFVRLVHREEKTRRVQALMRGASSAAGFVLFFAVLQLLTDYSILANYHAAHAYHYSMVGVGALSVGTHLLFALSNMSAFLLYLGIVHVALLMRRPAVLAWRPNRDIGLAGFAIVGLLILSGVYQAEVERLWLFLTPLFIPAILRIVRSSGLPHGAVAALLTFQIVATQALFYTYW